MKTIIAGSRDIHDAELLEMVIEQSGFEITTVFSGGAKGVDALGESWANKHCISVLKFPADWEKYGRGAGPVRNKEMAENAEACIVIWDGRNPGSKKMIELARKNGLLVHVYTFDAKRNERIFNKSIDIYDRRRSIRFLQKFLARLDMEWGWTALDDRIMLEIQRRYLPGFTVKGFIEECLTLHREGTSLEWIFELARSETPLTEDDYREWSYDFCDLVKIEPNPPTNEQWEYLDEWLFK